MDPVWKALSRRLGSGPGRELAPPAGPPTIVDTGDPDRRFLVVELAAGAGSEQTIRFVRMQTAVDDLAESALDEHRALMSPDLPERGTYRLDRVLTSPQEGPAILPPLFYCKQTRKWVAAWCSLRPWDPGADATACPACGTKDRGKCRSESALEVLWNGVQRSLDPAKAAPADDAAPRPACDTCERKRACYPANASPAAPPGAMDALVEVQPRPWIGAVIEPFHLSLEDWVSWIQTREPESPPAFPGAPSEPSGAGAAGLHRLVPAEFRSRAAAEALMVRLEALRVLLDALGSLIDSLGREHGDLRPQSLWFRVATGQPFVPLSWTAEPMLLDLAPDAARSAAHMPPQLRLVRQDSRRTIVDGVLIPRGETTEGEARRGAKFMFIPEDKCETPPVEGSPLFVIPDKGKETGHLEGYVENAFQDVFRVVVYLGDLSADALTDLVSDQGKTISLGLGTRPRGEADPDLYALGTIWFAMLRRGKLDLAAAAAFRDRTLDEMNKAGIDPTDHAAAVRWCRETALEAGAFIVHQRPGYDLAAAPEAHVLGRCIWIGLRLTSEIPGEGGMQAAREALRHLVRETEDLAQQARYLMLGRPTAAEEILGVVDLLEERELRR